MFDKLKIYRGSDIQINSKLIIKQPTLDQIVEFGERDYFGAVHNLVSVGADLKWQLWDMGIDYTTIDDYDLFLTLTYQLVSSKRRMLEIAENKAEFDEDIQQQLASISSDEKVKMQRNPLELITNIDFGDFEPCKVESTQQIVLYNQADDITIDRALYHQMIDLVRQIHGFKRNNELPANESTKMDLIEDARDEAMASQHKPYQSVLRPLVSYMKIINNQCGTDQIWNMKVNEFFYDLKKSGGMREAEMLLKGAYSGFASLKGVDTDKLNMLGDIETF